MGILFSGANNNKKIIMETWEKIVGQKGQYFISNFGRVRSIINHHGTDERIIAPALDKRGYQRVCLGNRPDRATYKVHRLVAMAFIPNPKNKRTVNHKNGIKDDNRVENLEWATDSENSLHSVHVLGRKVPKNRSNHKTGKEHFRSKKIAKINKITGEVLEVFESGNQAAIKNNLYQANIHRCASVGSGTTGGFKWKYL